MELESVEYDPYEILEISRVLSLSGSSIDHVILTGGRYGRDQASVSTAQFTLPSRQGHR